jgi:DNA polymerase III epsilon subunit-like protein
MTGAYNKRPERNKRTGTEIDFYWFIKDIDIAQEPMRLQTILVSVFAKLAMKCVITGESTVAPQMSSWLANLRELSNLHFDTSPQGIARDACWRNLGLMSVSMGEPATIEPPDYIFDFVPNCDHILAFDIETHDLAPKSKGLQPEWVEGQYGHPCRFQPSSLNQLRMVQLGWCISTSTGEALVEKTQFVYPTDFEITKPAQSKHRITNEQLRKSGKPLRFVLDEFLRDVADVINMGGAVCAHQLEFDAGIVALEMERAGLASKHEMWEQCISQGFCTMNYHVSKWSCAMYFDQTGCNGYLGRNSPIGLRNMVLTLVPEEHSLLQRHHDAQADAKMTIKVMRALQRKVAQFR